MLVTCSVTDFLNGQHLAGHPINSHLNCARPFVVSQMQSLFCNQKFSKSLLLRNLYNYLLEVELKNYNTNI